MPWSVVPLEATPQVVTLAEAQAYLYATAPEDAPLVQSLLEAAQSDCEQTAGLALGPRRYLLVLDGFPGAGCSIELPLPPAVSVESVQYRDLNGTLTTLDPAAYRAAVLGSPGRVSAVNSWPATDRLPESVQVRFTAGFGVGQCPPALRATVLAVLDYRWRNRGGDMHQPLDMPPAARRVLLANRAHLVG